MDDIRIIQTNNFPIYAIELLSVKNKRIEM